MKISKVETFLNFDAAHFRQKSIYLNTINSVWTVSRYVASTVVLLEGGNEAANVIEAQM